MPLILVTSPVFASLMAIKRAALPFPRGAAGYFPGASRRRLPERVRKNERRNQSTPFPRAKLIARYQSGTEHAAAIDATDMRRETSSTKAKTARHPGASGGHSAVTTPAPVATPLPPLQPVHGEKRCPAIAAPPARSAIPGCETVNAVPQRKTAKAGPKPFRKSNRKTGAANFAPSARYTFVAPGLPLPSARMSFPAASLVTI